MGTHPVVPWMGAGAILVVCLVLATSAQPALAVGQGGPVEQNVTASPGVVQTLHFECWASPNNPIPASALITATGEALGWVSPQHIGCGLMDPGADFLLPYNLTVPAGQLPGKYQLNWVGDCGPGCTFVSPGVVTITVPGTAGSPTTNSVSLLPSGMIPIALSLVVVLLALVMLAAIYRLRRKYPDAAT